MSQSRKAAKRFTARHEHLISTKAKAHPCHRCAIPILTAHDDGLLVHVDAAPITDKASELAALLDARDTYTHTIGGLLIQRTAARIKSQWLQGSIHATHKCAPNANVQEGLF